MSEYCFNSFFTDYTHSKGILYTATIIYVFTAVVAIIFEPFVNLPCDDVASGKFENPAYDDSICQFTRYPNLFYITKEECSFGRRIICSCVLGGIIGWERRMADRPAGIRTMSLVALGSCLFSICSAHAFLSGPMNWDGSRVAAAIPSGVGFLGAGLIFKQAQKDKDTGEENHTVHGLTTAASLWLSAAVGIACGGELYFSASFSVSVVVLLLRFGPRTIDSDSDSALTENDQEILINSTSPISPLRHHDPKFDKSSLNGRNNSFRKVQRPHLQN